MRLPWLGRRQVEERTLELTDALAGAFGIVPTSSGVPMSAESALRLTAVYGCVRILSETVASLPFPVYRRQGRSRVRVPEDERYELLNRQPNPEQTAFELWSMVMAHLQLWGNAYVVVDVAGDGSLALWPLDPRATRPERDRRTQALSYSTRLADGSEARIPPQAMIHVRGLVTVGDVGLSPIAACRNALGTAAAAEEYAGRFYANDATPRTFIIAPGRLDDRAQAQLRERFEGEHRGVRRAHLLGILTGGADLKTIGVPPEDSQLLESRKFGVREIARIFRVPPYLLADLEPGSVSYASVEQQALDFVVHSLRPWLVRIEQAVARTLFSTPADRARGVYPEWLVDGLLRGDAKTRAEVYASGIQHGWLSRADVRELENLPERPGLDNYLEPENMRPAGSKTSDELARLVNGNGA